MRELFSGGVERSSVVRVDRRGFRRATLVVAVLVSVVAGGMWLRDYLPASVQALEGRVEGTPSVVDVAVAEDDGDGVPFPLMRTSRHVTVVMDGAPTLDEVDGVLGAYADDVDDGDVVSVAIELQGMRTRLITCCGTRAGGVVIGDFLAAAADPHVQSYSREAVDGYSMVVADLDPLPFDEVVSYVERYAAIEPVEHVTVESGAFLIIRDEQFGPASVARIDARLRLVSRLVRQVGLAGADIADRSALVLRLDSADDRGEVDRLVSEAANEASIGKVRVVLPSTP